MMTQYQREEEQLELDLQEGRISQAEFNKQATEMERSHRAELIAQAEESAQRAYDDVMGSW